MVKAFEGTKEDALDFELRGGFGIFHDECIKPMRELNQVYDESIINKYLISFIEVINVGGIVYSSQKDTKKALL